jgi:urease accessory protein UreF
MNEQERLMEKMADELTELRKEVERLRAACLQQGNDICQTLGKVLGYPWYKDDQENFPGATESDGVCVGEHIAETLAMEAARRIVEANRESSRAKLELSRRRCNDSSRDSTLRSGGSIISW